MKRLVFISSSEMAHYISICYADFIRPLLFQEAAEKLNGSVGLKSIRNSKEYRLIRRQSLFLGLSDGAHTDLFRRDNPELSNEQVWQTYDISEKKADDLLGELTRDLTDELERKPSEEECRFKQLFLLDDFSGSGLSYIRKEAPGNNYAGKIFKVLSNLANKELPLGDIISGNDTLVSVVLYVATSDALTHIRNTLSAWIEESRSEFRIEVLTVQCIDAKWKLEKPADEKIIRLAQKYFNEIVIDEHYKKGRHERPYLGFNEASLPLVLYHNTPNNSIPIIWFGDEGTYRGVFPRVRRHKGEG